MKPAASAGSRRPGFEPAPRLPRLLDLNAAAALRDQLLAVRGTPCALDGSAVEAIGGLCLQVLLAAQASWAADRVAFAITAPSPALTAQLASFGAVSLTS